MKRVVPTLIRGAMLCGLLAGLSAAAQEQSEFAIIVHADNPVSSIRRVDLERIYRRYTRFWPDGKRVLPINAPFDTPLRRRFSRVVLRAGTYALITFWNRQYFQGVLPPPVLKSPDAVRSYVAQTRGAIGYVPPAYVDGTVKAVPVVSDDEP